MTLDQIKPGSSGIIAAVGGEGALRRRLLDMGLTPGTVVQVRRAAPMGDPIELFLRGYVLTLRLADASKIDLVQNEEEHDAKRKLDEINMAMERRKRLESRDHPPGRGLNAHRRTRG